MKKILIHLLLILLLSGCTQTGQKTTETVHSNHSQAQAADPQQAMLEQVSSFKQSHPELFGEAKGVLVTEVVPGSQGGKAGLKPGDILLIYDNISLNSYEHLIELTRKTKEDKSITLTYFRNKALHKIDIKGGKLGIGITSLISSQSKSLTQQMSDLIARGNGEFKAAQYEEAMQSYQSGLKIAKEAKDQIWIKEFLEKLALMYRDLNQHPNAKAHFEKSLSIAREIGDRFVEMVNFFLLGEVYENISQYPKALDHYQRALAIAHAIENRVEIDIRSSLGDVYVKINQYPKALDHYQKALTIAQKIGNDRNVAKIMNGKGAAYLELSQYREALDHFQKGLVIARKISDPFVEMACLGNLGNVYRELGQHSGALEHYQQSLAIAREVDDRTSVANSLNNLGLVVYLGLGQYPKALDYFEQALTIARDIGNRHLSARALVNLGIVYRRLGQFPKALDHYQQALTISREIGDSSNLSISLHNLGNVYRELGQNPKALDYYEQALSITRDIGNRHLGAKVMVNLGVVNRGLGRYSEALDYYQQALVIAREIGDRSVVAFILNNLGILHLDRSQYQEALAHFQQALIIAREIGNRDVSEMALSNQGIIYETLGQYSEALNKNRQALEIALSNNVPISIWRTWMNLSEIRYKLGQFDEAILAGKLAVNALQNRRAVNVRLEQDLQDSFLSDNAIVYHHLSKLLIEQNRFVEAEQVMAMLKEEEYFDFIQRDGKDDMRTTQAGYTQVESGIVKQIDQFSTQLVSLGKEYDNLEKLSQIDGQAKIRLAEVEKELEQAQGSFLNFLSSLEGYFKQAGSDKALEFGERQLAQLERQQDLLRKHQSVIVTTVATKDKLHLILTTPDVQLVRESAITEKDLNDLVKRFRNALKHPGSNPVPLAQELYAHLVKPLEKDLQQAQAKTLMWSLDGVLRYIPLATLHDGQQFLIEKYNLSLYTAAAQNNLHENNVSAWRAAGLGVSQAHPGFEALPAVPDELKNIIRQHDNDPIGVLPGEIYLDQAFNRDSFKSVIRAGFPVLHIASHFKLQPGDGSLSKLLLGDGDLLSLDEFRRQAAFKLHGVDLLTLSACDTAVGDKGTGGEVESFAVMAQLRGANGVLASLWRVEDESTGLLMKRLYRLRSENMQLSKAEALRQAQVAMLKGDLKAKESEHDFRHPYFWAPFVMMGNWL